ncbi:alcohol dehydrogenase catalytic domain-containing protein [Streptomyces humicola]|uniref:alcohol dehydrogenase catalytic domain-containing protein n=1 Tax=Streptomyces humicola TaxID=2953240 RepID=UPI0027E2C5A9|nr:alcohol dehydrogenase catalytic domain-containing protein [Streptomyces humicola]
MIEEFGGPDVLRLAETGTPEPKAGEDTIDVAYAGVNFADIKSRSTGYQVPGLPFTPGLEVSGRTRAVGEGVTGLSTGQAVTAFTDGGGYAEVVAAPAVTVFPLADAAAAHRRVESRTTTGKRLLSVMPE